ncbi:hypothetical protein Pmani_027520 [Petrolisthes manimaculis]|uniref:Coatomer subunit delta n=1 Tax=Petrolisthes manimaculis TaxID=1843537 RepID=A0AAE1TWR0_9EUCA|nr:hypothetical protein Pmani_027520 [Petrolisthes manimaculis]
MDEAEILDNSFNLIFAFDEIVALGYRESVNLAQIRTFVEMDSHEEKVYRAVRETQEREARTKSKEKAKELQRKRTEEMKRSGGRSITSGGINNTNNNNNNSGGFGVSGGFGGVSSTFPVEAITTNTQDTRSPSIKSSNKAMKLGGKTRDVDSFVDQLKSEGEKVTSSDNITHNKTTNNTPDIDMEPLKTLTHDQYKYKLILMLIVNFGKPRDKLVLGVVGNSDGAAVNFSQETQLKTNTYEIN